MGQPTASSLEWAEVCTGLPEVLISPLEITELWTLSSKQDLGKGWWCQRIWLINMKIHIIWGGEINK